MAGPFHFIAATASKFATELGEVARRSRTDLDGGDIEMLNLSELETDLRRTECDIAEFEEEIEHQKRMVSQIEDRFFHTYAETLLTSFEEQKEVIVAERERIVKQLSAA